MHEPRLLRDLSRYFVHPNRYRDRWLLKAHVGALQAYNIYIYINIYSLYMCIYYIMHSFILLDDRPFSLYISIYIYMSNIYIYINFLYICIYFIMYFYIIIRQ